MIARELALYLLSNCLTFILGALITNGVWRRKWHARLRRDNGRLRRMPRPRTIGTLSSEVNTHSSTLDKFGNWYMDQN